ncbi:MAG: polysaccharide deacetylase family protein [Candidatus Latescibacteria bacterium]|nr:polysaccharide deacetylase family protein [Candidatus Latescibacterota bacterium]
MYKPILTAAAIVVIACGCQYLYNSESYHETVVVITFDDAHKSIYTKAFPLMQKYGYPATNYVPVNRLDIEDHLTVGELHILEDEGGWETGGHTVHHVNLPQVKIEEAEKEIAGCFDFLVENSLQHCTFALPSGHANEEIIGIIKKYFSSIRGSEDFKMTCPADCYSLGYYDARNTDGSEKIIARILRGITNHECVVIIGFHYIYADKSLHSRAVTPQEFNEVLEFINERNLKVKTVSQMLEEW